MNPLRYTIGRTLLIVAALCVGFAAFRENNVWFLGLSMMSIIAFLGAAVGAEADRERPRRSSL